MPPSPGCADASRVVLADSGGALSALRKYVCILEHSLLSHKAWDLADVYPWSRRINTSMFDIYVSWRCKEATSKESNLGMK